MLDVFLLEEKKGLLWLAELELVKVLSDIACPMVGYVGAEAV